MTIRNLTTCEYGFVDFTRRGWFAKSDAFKLEGSLFTAGQKASKKSNEAFETKGG
jgi:hypothetical protein